VPTVTSPRPRRDYLIFIEHRDEFGETKQMTAAFKIKFASLALAAAFFLPAALATLNQAALIVA